MPVTSLKAASRLLSEGVRKTPLPNLPAVYKNAIYRQVRGNGRTSSSARPQPNKPTSPTLTRKDYIQIGKALRRTIALHGSLHGYKTIRALAIAIKAKILAWPKLVNHPENLKFLRNLNRTVTGSAKPEKMYPSRYSDSQRNQRVYASWLLHRYVDRLTAAPPKISYKQLAKVGSALERTRHTYRWTIGHKSLVSLTCALRASLNVKWKWYKLASRVHRYLVAMLNIKMPKYLKPRYRFPVSAGFRRAYSRWLLIQYVRYAKLKAPPAPIVNLTEKQRKLYLKHAVFPAVWTAGTRVVLKPVEARRYLIWAKYTSLEKLPVDLYTKLSRYTLTVLKLRQFKAIRQQIADYRAQYCPSGNQKIKNAMYREAVWTSVAIADAKSARQRAKPARVEAVALTARQKRIVLSAIYKAANKYVRQMGKRGFRNTVHLKQYLRKNGWIWSRLTSNLNNKLTIALGQLLLGRKLGKLPRQLSKLRRGTPKMLYNSAVFDTNIGYITVNVRKLPGTGTATTRPAVALKPLHLSRMALVFARKRLLRAWKTTRTLHTNLPNYRSSRKLASYLKSHGSRLSNDEKKWLFMAFKSSLNSSHLRSIKPKVKAPLEQAKFTKRVYLAILKAAEGTAPVIARPTPPRPVRPRPSNPQVALQQGLVTAVRAVYGTSTSEEAAKTVLKTQRWGTLKRLGIVGLIQKKFAGLGYKRAARSSYYARLLVKKTLRNWNSSPDTSTTTTHTPVSPARPTPPAPRPSDKQAARQGLLIAAVRSVYGASTSEAAAITVFKTQKWRVLKQLGIASYIMKGFARLGYARASKNRYLARKLVKKTLANWQASSSSSAYTPPSRPVPARPASSAVTPAQRKAYVRAALLKALRSKGLANTAPEAIAFAKGQKWSTLVALKLHEPFIAALNADGRLGKWRPQNSRRQTRAARKLYRLLKK